MATFTGEWTNGTLHSSSSITNGGTATDNVDLDALGYFGIRGQIDFDIASGSPAGDVVVQVFGSCDNGTNKYTEADQTFRIPFSATGNKKQGFTVFFSPYASVKLTNNTGVTGTYVGRYSGFKQASA
jgi:hypothetical protein